MYLIFPSALVWYDFSNSIHQEFIEEKYNNEDELAEFEGMAEDEIKEKLKNK